MTEKSIEIIKPDDWHVHLRDKELLKKVLPFTYKHFKSALIMPNLNPPITTSRQVENYYQKICANIPLEINFDPLMTLYLSEDITTTVIKSLANHQIIKAIKMYPKGATTNSEFGISNFKSFYPIFEAMERNSVVLCIHGEVTDENIDVFEREKVFIDTILIDLIKVFPNFV